MALPANSGSVFSSAVAVSSAGRRVVGEPAGSRGRAFEAEDAGVLGDQRPVAVPAGQGELVAVADEQQRGPGRRPRVVRMTPQRRAGRERRRGCRSRAFAEDVVRRSRRRPGRCGSASLAARHGGGDARTGCGALADQRRRSQSCRPAGGCSVVTVNPSPSARCRGRRSGRQRGPGERADLVVGAEGGADRGDLGGDLVRVDGPLGEPGPGPVLPLGHRVPLGVEFLRRSCRSPRRARTAPAGRCWPGRAGAATP